MNPRTLLRRALHAMTTHDAPVAWTLEGREQTRRVVDHLADRYRGPLLAEPATITPREALEALGLEPTQGTLRELVHRLQAAEAERDDLRRQLIQRTHQRDNLKGMVQELVDRQDAYQAELAELRARLDGEPEC